MFMKEKKTANIFCRFLFNLQADSTGKRGESTL